MKVRMTSRPRNCCRLTLAPSWLTNAKSGAGDGDCAGSAGTAPSSANATRATAGKMAAKMRRGDRVMYSDYTIRRRDSRAAPSTGAAAATAAHKDRGKPDGWDESYRTCADSPGSPA